MRARENSPKLDRPDSHDGSDPVNALLVITNCFKFDRFESDDGRVETKKFPSRYIFSVGRFWVSDTTTTADSDTWWVYLTRQVVQLTRALGHSICFHYQEAILKKEDMLGKALATD